MPAIDPRNIEVVDPAQAERYGQMTMAERIAMIGAANRTARALIAAGARAFHPDWTEAEIQSEVIRRMGRGTARSAATRRPDA